MFRHGRSMTMLEIRVRAWCTRSRATMIVFGLFIVTIAALNFKAFSRSVSGVNSPSIAIRGMNTVMNQYLSTKAKEPTFLVWTYAAPVPASAQVGPADTVVCSYQECRDAFPGSIGIDLREMAQNSVFERFVNHHMYQKIRLGMDFPHHIQSIALILLAKQNPTACARTLGSSYAVCFEDVQRYNSYDPELDGVLPIFRPTFKVEMDNVYSVLDYEKTLYSTGFWTCNIGDEVQSFGGAQFYPYVNSFTGRNQDIQDASGSLTLNAWYGNKFMWPPNLDRLNPLAVAMHFQGPAVDVIKEHVGWLINEYNPKHGAVGARDTATLEILEKIGVQAYFSACMTLTINMGSRGKRFDTGRKTVYNVDANPKFLPEEINNRAERHYQSLGKREEIVKYRMKRYENARGLVQGYAERAKVVITSRIHSALPALAQGAPVIFVHASSLPGGGGGRTGGLVDLFHIYTPGTEWTFDVDNMPPNPGVHKADRYRAAFWNTYRRRSQVFIDSAKLFGWIPLKRLGEGVHFDVEPTQDLFHFVHNEASKEINWRMVRSVEYVFYHHPNARVIIHSNILPVSGSRFSIFSEAGYSLSIQPYDLDALSRMAYVVDLPELTSQSPSHSAFIEAMASMRQSAHAKVHEKELLSMLVVLAHGGVFLDFDRFVLKPIPRAIGDTWTAGNNGISTLIFSRDSSALRDAIKVFLASYDASCFGCNAESAFKAAPSRRDDLGFSPLDARQISECFESSSDTIDVSGALVANLDADKTQQYKATLKGSSCDKILHKFCILCDEVRTGSTPFSGSVVLPP